MDVLFVRMHLTQSGVVFPIIIIIIIIIIAEFVGRYSAVGILTRNWLDCPGIVPGGGVVFSVPIQNGPGAHPASCKIGTGFFFFFTLYAFIVKRLMRHIIRYVTACVCVLI
jgi:hypothetical protein